MNTGMVNELKKYKMKPKNPNNPRHIKEILEEFVELLEKKSGRVHAKKDNKKAPEEGGGTRPGAGRDAT